jgi:hypothetical protein
MLEKIGIDKHELIERCNTMLDLLKNKPTGYDMDLFNNITTISGTLKDHWDLYKTYIAIVPLCIIQEGDDIAGYDQSECMAKVNKWSKDKTMMDFFLNSLSKMMK